ncbi:alpha-L-rhamnosidase-related protein [Cohnella fermenti]|uniref:Alpha-L-rhamnosidase n=1 Tax=Cohnella fermenti TaxID=2565925 RepID=A0A4S4BQF8_9BACL|nr:alpha-L-rhamnosidase C-terminal domain-containing protein [Cohnella fermenti]THF74832.1 alpha-L-rhamnosidase [Cohnella fermenti]
MPHMPVKKISRDRHPFEDHERERSETLLPWEYDDYWPSAWIRHPGRHEPPFVSAFALRFEALQGDTVVVHVSADERYELYYDGERVGRGSERGGKSNWFYESYEFDIRPGAHTLAARVWSLGKLKPWAQATIGPGFILAPESERWTGVIGTGNAQWQSKRLRGYGFAEVASKGIGTGAKLLLDGSLHDWGFERGEGDGWMTAEPLHSGNNGYVYTSADSKHIMQPSGLPPMLEQPITGVDVRYVASADSLETSDAAIERSLHLPEESGSWSALLNAGQPLLVPPRTGRRIVIDMDNYYCLYPELVTSGGAGSAIRLRFAEALYRREGNRVVKRNRNDIEDCRFVGIGDTFLPDGGDRRRWGTLWWHAGRYAELTVITADEPLWIQAVVLTETRYPLRIESEFRCSDDRWNAFVPIALRSQELCMHETYMDCPYWEQMMYVGDSRLEALLQYVLTKDDRLTVKSLQMFERSRRNPTGLVACAWPDGSGKIIPSFCFWWVLMVYDYALWRGDRSVLAGLLPGVRDVLERLLLRSEDGLLRSPRGWNFMDWQAEWPGGIPPHGGEEISGIYNWLAVCALKQTAAVERYMGEEELASRWERLAAALAEAADRAFWNEERGLYADDRKMGAYSEHAQCMALLSGSIGQERARRVEVGLAQDSRLTRTSIFFAHYLFEVYSLLEGGSLPMDRLGQWFELESRGFRTTPEVFEDETRSDCHAWGAHPLYHFYATVLGIRPSSMGFAEVAITPRLGDLREAEGEMVHPLGVIRVRFARDDEGGLSGIVELPEGLQGFVYANGEQVRLRAGKMKVDFTGRKV